jgi:hypothetical protein
MLVVACIAGNAKADLWDQYQALGVIPLPPAAEPNFELGARYWASQGNTYFSFNSSKHDPALGNPTSTLNYDNTNGNSGEITSHAQHPRQGLRRCRRLERRQSRRPPLLRRLSNSPTPTAASKATI